MKSILIVDDEIEIVNSLSEYLIEKNFHVTGCNSADEALRHYNSSTPPDLILSDIKMPGKSGLDLYKLCLELQNSNPSTKKIPFVLMTSYTDIIGVENAFNMGVSELIAKPFDAESLTLVLNYLLELDDAYGTAEKYYPVHIEEFINSKTIEFDIYLKIGERFVLVTKSGQEFSEQRLRNFAKKGVKNIYMSTDHFAKYTDMQFVLVNHIKKRPIDQVKKTKVMSHLMNTISHNFMGEKLDRDFFNNALSSFEAFAHLALDNEQICNVMHDLVKTAPSAVDKAAVRAMMCSMVANYWKWNSSKFQSRMILGALLCDIGLKDHPELMEKSLYQMNTSERQIFEQHPHESYRMLREIPNMPDEVAIVALQHHENSAGLGFPQKLMRVKLHSFSVVVHCVDEFVEALFLGKNNMDVKKILDDLFEVQGRMLSQQVIKTLYILFQLPVPTKLESLLLPTQTSRLN